jgi:hypothetical protein
MFSSEFQWTVNKSTVVLCSPHWKAYPTIDSSSVSLLIESLHQPDNLNHLQLLGVSLDDVEFGEADQHVRGVDYIIRLPANKQREYAVEIYYRAKCVKQDLLIFESIISLHTDQLDLQPQLSVFSLCKSVTAPAIPDELNFVDKCSGNMHIVQIANDQFLAMAVMPSDFSSGKTTMGNIEFELAPGRLEKGVIRRMRIQAAICTNGKMDEMHQQMQQFENSEIPLTT